MFNPLDVFKPVKKFLTTTLVFELANDPTEGPEGAGVHSPVSVWFLVSEESEPLPLARETFTSLKGSVFLGQITRATPQDLRTFSTLELSIDKRPYVYVLAEPTAGWEQTYGPRQSVIRITPTRSYNIVVSLPRLKIDDPAAGPADEAGPAKRFRL
ncbi:MAG TPA: hypothetical protein VGN07_09665 [Steroidobacteraceae bacterium]|jgi:hypothetical protein